MAGDVYQGYQAAGGHMRVHNQSQKSNSIVDPENCMDHIITMVYIFDVMAVQMSMIPKISGKSNTRHFSLGGGVAREQG